ncbi:hypothetical protein C8R45DRAFT_1074195 [Mycena sanguinolenta]|nr:hypothetical protein C8R45DRAFT_1074195 [Mycena sanguinolenta]
MLICYHQIAKLSSPYLALVDLNWYAAVRRYAMASSSPGPARGARDGCGQKSGTQYEVRNGQFQPKAQPGVPATDADRNQGEDVRRVSIVPYMISALTLRGGNSTTASLECTATKHIRATGKRELEDTHRHNHHRGGWTSPRQPPDARKIDLGPRSFLATVLQSASPSTSTPGFKGALSTIASIMAVATGRDCCGRPFQNPDAKGRAAGQAERCIDRSHKRRTRPKTTVVDRAQEKFESAEGEVIWRALSTEQADIRLEA